MQISYFDSYRNVKYLKDAGFTEKQAEAITKGIINGMYYDLSKLVTKEDLEVSIAGVKKDLEVSIAGVQKDMNALEHGLRKDIELIVSQLEIKIEKSQNTNIKWMIGLIAPLYGIFIIATVKYLFS